MPIKSRFSIKLPGVEDFIIFILIVSTLALYDIDYLCLGSQLVALCITGIRIFSHNMKVDKEDSYFLLWMCVFCAFCVFSMVWSSVSNKTVLSCSMSTVQVCLIAFSIINYGKSEERRDWIIKSFIGSCIILSVRFFLTVPITNWGNQQRFSNDTFFGSNMIAVTLAYGAFLLLDILLKKMKKKGYVFKLPYVIGIVIFLFVSMIIGTKKGIMVFAVGLAVIFVGNSKNLAQLVLRIVMMVLMIAVGYYIIMNVDVLYSSIGYRVESMLLSLNGGKTDDRSTSERILFIKEAWNVFKEFPLLGIGLDGFRYINPYYSTYSHNNYVELLADVGLVGCVLYYSIWLFITKKALKIGKQGLTILALAATVFVVDFASVSYSDELTFIILAMCLTMQTNIYDNEVVCYE